jgi:hypothetical protein
MTILPERRGGGGYGTEHADERPSEEALLDVDLVGGKGAERAGLRAGGVSRYSGR